MIGRFHYNQDPPATRLTVNISGTAEQPVGGVRIPPHILPLLFVIDVPIRHEEHMQLAVALGYAVSLAGLSGSSLIVSGDRSVWPRAWGALIEHDEEQE